MSSPVQSVVEDRAHAIETTPLLSSTPTTTAPLEDAQNSNSDNDNRSNPSSTTWIPTIQSIPFTLRLAPPLFLAAMADNMTYFTIIDIMKRFLCAAWYARHLPDELPDEGPLPVEKCQTPGPVAWFSAFMVVQNVLIAVGGFLISSLVAQYGAMIGRKPVLLLTLLGLGVSLTSFAALLFVSNDIVAFTLMAVWMVNSSLFGVLAVLLLCNLIIVDVTTPENRTTSLSIVFGALSAGSIPAFLLGGIIEKHIGPRILFMLAIGIVILAFLYASTPMVPETFSKDKREAARIERRERYRQARERSLERWNAEEGDATRGIRRVARKTAGGIQTIFDPIMRFKPTRKTNGRWNTRLSILGSSYFFYTLGLGYVGPAMVSYMAVVLMQDPEQNGVVFSSYMVMQLISYILVFPAIVKWGRIFYAKFYAKRRPRKEPDNLDQDSDRNQDQRSFRNEDEERQPLISAEDTIENPNSELSSAHFDVYILRWCYTVASIFLLVVGFTHNKIQLILASGLVMFFSGSHPTAQSIGAASVDPIIAGEIIAGLEMTGNVGKTLSPVMIGYVQSKTLLTMPMVIFLSMGACSFMSVIFSLFIRDDDRYIPSPSPLPPLSETINSEEGE